MQAEVTVCHDNEATTVEGQHLPNGVGLEASSLEVVRYRRFVERHTVRRGRGNPVVDAVMQRVSTTAKTIEAHPNVTARVQDRPA